MSGWWWWKERKKKWKFFLLLIIPQQHPKKREDELKTSLCSGKLGIMSNSHNYVYTLMKVHFPNLSNVFGSLFPQFFSCFSFSCSSHPHFAKWNENFSLCGIKIVYFIFFLCVCLWKKHEFFPPHPNSIQNNYSARKHGFTIHCKYKGGNSET